VLIRCVENTCDRDAGPLGKKCPRCAAGRYSYVPVEDPLFGSLKTCKEARDALARSNERGDSVQVIQSRINRAVAAVNSSLTTWPLSRSIETGPLLTVR
jgi:hypothetical protein